MTTFRNDTVGPIRVPPHPNERLPHNTTCWAICGWPVHYHNAYHPTTTIIELCRFTGHHNSGMRSIHNQMLVHGSTTNGPQMTQERLPPWSFEYPRTTPHPSHMMILHFPLVAPPTLKFKSKFIQFILYQVLTILIPLR
jgi:hypothetical protein